MLWSKAARHPRGRIVAGSAVRTNQLFTEATSTRLLTAERFLVARTSLSSDRESNRFMSLVNYGAQGNTRVRTRYSIFSGAYTQCVECTGYS